MVVFLWGGRKQRTDFSWWMNLSIPIPADAEWISMSFGERTHEPKAWRREDTVCVGVRGHVSLLLRPLLCPGLASCYWIQDSCWGYIQAKVGSSKRNPCICVPRWQSQLLSLPGLPFKDKASTFSSIPPADRCFWIPHLMVSAGLSFTRKNRVRSLLPTSKFCIWSESFCFWVWWLPEQGQAVWDRAPVDACTPYPPTGSPLSQLPQLLAHYKDTMWQGNTFLMCLLFYILYFTNTFKNWKQ